MLRATPHPLLNVVAWNRRTVELLWKQCQNIVEFGQFILNAAKTSTPVWFASITVEFLSSHGCVVLTAAHPVNLCERKGVSPDAMITAVAEIGGKFVDWMTGVLALSPSTVDNLRVIDDALQLWFNLFADMTDAHPLLKVWINFVLESTAQCCEKDGSVTGNL